LRAPTAERGVRKKKKNQCTNSSGAGVLKKSKSTKAGTRERDSDAIQKSWGAQNGNKGETDCAEME